MKTIARTLSHLLLLAALSSTHIYALEGAEYLQTLTQALNNKYALEKEVIQGAIIPELNETMDSYREIIELLIKECGDQFLTPDTTKKLFKKTIQEEDEDSISLLIEHAPLPCFSTSLKRLARYVCLQEHDDDLKARPELFFLQDPVGKRLTDYVIHNAFLHPLYNDARATMLENQTSR